MVTEAQQKTQEMVYVTAPSATSSGQPLAYYDIWLGFDAYCPKLEAAKRKVADWYNDGYDRGEALVLAGGYGSGKTHLARVVLGASLFHLTHFISEPDLLSNLRATYGGEGSEKMLMGNYRRAALLMIDDVGTAHVKPTSQEWLEEIYWRLFDRRAEKHLPTLLTTNLTLAGLAQRLGGKAFSRLQEMTVSGDNFVDMFDVPDYRARGWK